MGSSTPMFLILFIFINNTVCYDTSAETIRRFRQSNKRNPRITGFSEKEKRNIVNIHNRLRRKVGASDMQLMTWSSELGHMAQNYAKKCNFHHSVWRVTPRGSAGENIAARANYYSEKWAIEAWFSEIRYYRYKTDGCTNVCKHFKQLTHSSSNEVGCGVSFCSHVKHTNLRKAYIMVCHYLKAGNNRGKRPYKKGKACSACPSGMNYCNGGLCMRRR